MPNKITVLYPNNLLEIRTALCYTQKQMGEILDVSSRRVCDYETGGANLPIDKAMILHNKYNYSLDYIYRIEDNYSNNIHSQEMTTLSDKFIVDIRDFISFSDNMYHFSIPDYHKKFLYEKSAILDANITESDKSRQIAELNGKYNQANPENVVWKFSIPKDEMCSYINIDSKCTLYVGSDNDIKHTPTLEQVEKFEKFLSELSKTD